MKKYYLKFDLKIELDLVKVKAEVKQDYDMSVSSKEECLEALREYSGGDVFNVEIFDGLDFMPSTIFLNLDSGEVEYPRGVKVGKWELTEEPFGDSWIQQEVDFTFILPTQEIKDGAMKVISEGMSECFGEESEVEFVDGVLTISTPSSNHKTVARFEVE